MRKLLAAVSAVEWVLIALAAAGAIVSWVVLEASEDDIGVGIVGYLGAYFGLGLLGAFVRCAVEGVESTVTRLRSLDRLDSMRVQMRALCAPRAVAWLLPLATAPVLAATLPVAFSAAPGDASVVGVLALFVFVVSYLGMLLGFLVWLLVVLPLLLLGRSLGRRLSGVTPDANDRFAVAFGLLLLSIVVFAVALVLSTPDVGGSRAERKAGRFAALFGLNDARVDPAWGMWLARAALVGIVVSIVLVVRASKKPRVT